MQTATLDTRDLLARITSNGGITVNLDGVQPDKGFAVSIPGHETRCQWALTETDLRAYIHANMPALTVPGTYLGAWFDPDENTWYLDTSFVLDDERAAVKLGAQWGQKAVYDLSTGLTLHVPQWLHYTSAERGGIAP